MNKKIKIMVLILVGIVFVLELISFYGLLNPIAERPSRCYLGMNFRCVDFEISKTENYVKLMVNNPNNLDVESVDLFEDDKQFVCKNVPTNGSLKNQSVLWLNWSECNFKHFEKGKQIKMHTSIHYLNESEDISVANGEIFAIVR